MECSTKLDRLSSDSSTFSAASLKLGSTRTEGKLDDFMLAPHALQLQCIMRWVGRPGKEVVKSLAVLSDHIGKAGTD
jgi:hypothetical protein